MKDATYTLADSVTILECGAPEGVTVTRRQNLDRKAEQLGLKVFTWSPGDGTTRYRFAVDSAAESYHFGDWLFTALGLHEAEVFLKGYALGRLYK